MYTYEKKCRGLWGIKRERIGLRWKVLGRLIIFWCNCNCNWMHKLGNLHSSALEIAPGLGPRAISQASGCKLPQGAYVPIHPSSRQCIITSHAKKMKFDQAYEACWLAYNWMPLVHCAFGNVLCKTPRGQKERFLNYIMYTPTRWSASSPWSSWWSRWCSGLTRGARTQMAVTTHHGPYLISLPRTGLPPTELALLIWTVKSFGLLCHIDWQDLDWLGSLGVLLVPTAPV